VILDGNQEKVRSMPPGPPPLKLSETIRFSDFGGSGKKESGRSICSSTPRKDRSATMHLVDASNNILAIAIEPLQERSA